MKDKLKNWKIGILIFTIACVGLVFTGVVVNNYSTNRNNEYGGLADTTTATSISISGAYSVAIGGDIVLSVSPTPADADIDISWTAPDGVSVSSTAANSATVTGVTAGTYTITARDKNSGNYATHDVKVVSNTTATSISISCGNSKVAIGSTKTLSVSYEPSDANTSITWSSDSTAKATVSQNGVVTGVSSGAATITATDTVSGKSASCTMTVFNQATSVSVGTSDDIIAVGETTSLAVSSVPSDADIDISWVSGDVSVATVNSSGKVTGVGVGTAEIRATDKNTGRYGTKTITVIGTTATSISVGGVSTLGVGDETTLSVTSTPADASLNINWSSSNSDIATVDSTTGKVTGVSLGDVTITALDTYSGNSATFSIKVSTIKKADDFEISGSSYVPVGMSKTLYVSADPSDAILDIEWGSGDMNIATVDSTGKVTGVSTGDVIITAKDNNTLISKMFAIQIIRKLEMINIVNTKRVLGVGENTTINTEIVPDDTVVDIKWRSYDTTIATVDSTGKITGVSRGTTEIVGVDTYSGVSVSFEVKVINEATDISIEGYTSLVVDKTSALSVTSTPSNADLNLNWRSDDTSVVSVDSTGTIKGVSKGTAIVTVVDSYTGLSKNVTVIVGEPITTLVLTSDKTTITVGENVVLNTTFTPTNAFVNMKWTSSNTAVATVDQSGKVTGVSAGKTTIEVTDQYSEKKRSVEITVTASVEVESITLNESAINLVVDETKSLVATVLPENATDKTVTWSSSADDVATVNQNGLITGKKAGTATITASAGDKTTTATVTVTVPVTSISLDKTTISLVVGEYSDKVIATVLPENATNKTVTWTTSNGAVATVSSGEIKGVSPGTAVITAKAGDKTATVNVTVTSGGATTFPVTSITLNRTEASLKVGESYNLVATVLPYNATNKTVTWSVDKTDIASVDQNGLVTGNKVGTATITARAGDKTATATITVTAATSSTIPVASISLSMSEISLKVSNSFQLSATVLPDNATNKTVTWTSSNSSIVSVNAGLVTGVAVGTATITATAGEETATATVTVTANGTTTVAVDSVTLDKETITLNVGEYSDKVIATVLPENATNKTVTWTTSNGAVAIVSSGEIKGVSPGEAIITATAGGKTDTVRVVVNSGSTLTVPVESITLNMREISLKVGEFFQLKETVLPLTASNKNVNWTTSNGGIATVSTSGLVKGISAGTATITASIFDSGGYKKATVKVVVSSSSSSSDSSSSSSDSTVDVTEIYKTGSNTGANLTMNKGDNLTLQVGIKPSNATNQSVSWTSSNNNAVSISSSGKTATITAKAVTTNAVTITATSSNGKSVTWSVSVKEAVAGTTVELKSITLDGDYRVTAGGTASIKAFLNTVGGSPDITWKLVGGNDSATLSYNGYDAAITASSSAKVGTEIVVQACGVKETSICDMHTITVYDPDTTTDTPSDDNNGGEVGEGDGNVNVPETDLNVPMIIIIGGIALAISGAYIVFKSNVFKRKNG